MVFDARTGARVDPLPADDAPGGKNWPDPPTDPDRGPVWYSPDGRWVVGEQSIHPARDRTTGELTNLIQRYGRDARGQETVPLWALTPYSFSPDGHVLAAGYNTRLYAVRLPDFEIVGEMNHHPKMVQGAAFTADGRHLLSVSNAATVRVWDAGTWAERHAYAWEVGPLKCVAVAPDGTRAACGGDKGKVVVWDLDL